MKPSKAYILKTNDPRSEEYAKDCSISCDRVGLPWEYFEGVNYKKIDGNRVPEIMREKAKEWGVEMNQQLRMNGAAACCTIGHFAIWRKIAEGDECCIVLEHDVLMLHKPDIDIPNMKIVCLGYKVTDPENYKHGVAGPPKTIEDRQKHGGAHAYAFTPETAKHLLQILKDKGRVSYVDNQYFLSSGQRGNATLGIMDPIAAIGWLRESTIWSRSAVDNYAPILDSFKNNYDSKKDLGVKK